MVKNPDAGYNNSGGELDENWVNKPIQTKKDNWTEWPNIVAVQDGLETYFQ